MAFFAESTYEESYQDLGIVVNDYTDFDTLALESCDVIEEMNNAILYGIGHYELDMIREGAEVVYTEGMLDSIKDKITSIWNHSKNWIANIWNKFIAYIESYIRGDKEFLQKYDKQLKENLNYLDKDFKKTYKYAGMISDPLIVKDEWINDTKALTSDIIKYINSGKNIKDLDKYEKFMTETIYFSRKCIRQYTDDFIQLDVSKSIDSSWIKKNFKNIEYALLMDIPEIKKMFAKSVKVSEDMFKDVYDKCAIKNTDIDGTRDEKTISTLVMYSTLSAEMSKHLNTINGVAIKYIKGIKSDARSMCRVILSASKPTKESTFESYFNI